MRSREWPQSLSGLTNRDVSGNPNDRSFFTPTLIFMDLADVNFFG